MAKRKGGKKIRQTGFVAETVKNHHAKKQHAPWDDPLKQIMRGGSRH